LSLEELGARLAQVRRGMEERRFGAFVVYGDREHAANPQWLSGFDPHVEEVVLVVTPSGARLLAGTNPAAMPTSPLWWRRGGPKCIWCPP
jgi:hypothetical protein